MRVCCACVKCEWEDSLTRRRSERLEIAVRSARLGFAVGFPNFRAPKDADFGVPVSRGLKKLADVRRGSEHAFRTRFAICAEFLATSSLPERQTYRERRPNKKEWAAAASPLPILEQRRTYAVWILISMSTPAGSSRRCSESTVFGDGSRMSRRRL